MSLDQRHGRAKEELRERIVPMVSQVPGFVSGFWMEAGCGKGDSVVIFGSEEAANRMGEQVRSNAPCAVTIESVDVRAVGAHA
jgi:hypothetical protein